MRDVGVTLYEMRRNSRHDNHNDGPSVWAPSAPPKHRAAGRMSTLLAGELREGPLACDCQRSARQQFACGTIEHALLHATWYKYGQVKCIGKWTAA